ncbi:MAG: hypothetical protein Q8K98_06445 [Bacteroidota bacterium]|nr:hypothetical protein [Bacteroidota bacterium]
MKNKSEVRNSKYKTNPNFQNINFQIVDTTLIIRILNLFRDSKFGFRYLNILLFVFCCLLFFSACRERVVPPDDKPPYVPPIVLTAEDIGVTDAFIRLKFLDTSNVQAKTFKLTRDGKPLITNTLFTNDTLLLDEGLLPKRTYIYKAYRFFNNTPVDSSAPLTITSMDSTSHNFNFEVFYLGDGNSSVLRDVFILNDTLAYAVGEIYKKDSTGQFDTDAYNAAVWNGKVWELKRIQFYTFCGPGSLTGPYPANAVFAFDDGEIWIASQSQIAKWKNGVQISITCLPVSVNKIWGSSKNNVYTAGPLGQIGFYNGSSWRRLESGTNQTINDVWGVQNSSGKSLILCAASNQFELGDRRILRINPQGTVDSINWRSDRRAASIWFANESRLFVCGGGVFIRRYDGTWSEQTTIPLYYTYRIRGVANNDVFVAGGFGLVTHFNGVSWFVWENLGAFIWYSANYSGGMFVAVGQTSNRAVVIIMRR